MNVTKEDLELGRRFGLTPNEVKKAMDAASKICDDPYYCPPNHAKWNNPDETSPSLSERVSECRQADIPGKLVL